MSVGSTGELVCSYCGSRFVMSDEDLTQYRDFRGRMQAYLSAVANQDARAEDTEWIWKRVETARFRTADGQDVEIEYIYQSVDDGVPFYVARKNVIYVFPSGQSYRAESYAAALALLDFPQGDVRDLSQYFPVRSGTFPLEGGQTMLVLTKSEELFPLAAYGSLPPVHAAWVVSRLENLCCVLEYSGIAHGGIALESVFINARTHEAHLLGGWWKAARWPGGSVRDLKDLRAAARRLMGVQYSSAPAEFRRFIEEAPEPDAYQDFSRWDRVIDEGFGGRRFEKLDLTNLKI